MTAGILNIGTSAATVLYLPRVLLLDENRTTVSSMHKKKTLFFRLEAKREREKKKEVRLTGVKYAFH